MRVSGERLRESMLSMAKIGATPRGGVNRPALSREDKLSRDLLVEWIKEIGLRVDVDELGNIFGRREGTLGSVPPVLVGSHLDTVPNGGRFDGALGVMAGLEVMRTLADGGVTTKRPVELVSFTNEEGACFQPAMIASGVMAGRFTKKFAYSIRDQEGRLFGEELERIGYKGTVKCQRRDIWAYLELHVEQGPVLEAEGLQIGVVEGIVGVAWFHLTLRGEKDHAGPTPIRMRRDALLAASRVVVAVRGIAAEMGEPMVTTVGNLTVDPNIINVIPGSVAMMIDMRDPEEGRVEEAAKKLDEVVRKISEEERVQRDLKVIWRIPPTHFSPDVISVVQSSCERLGYGHRRMISGAGHDAKYMNEITRAGMIFVPSKGGKSHCEEEDSDWEDVERGANLLLHAVLELAGTDSDRARSG